MQPTYNNFFKLAEAFLAGTGSQFLLLLDCGKVETCLTTPAQKQACLMARGIQISRFLPVSY
jgi:hypothetical protein